MATFTELAILIAQPMGRELDEPFKEQLKARIRYWRAKLLRDSLNKNPKDRTHFIQSITLPMVTTSANACGIPLNCTVQKTSVKVPIPIRANNVLVDYVGGTDGSNPFTLVPRWKIPFLATAKYSKDVTYAAWEDRDIVVPNNVLLAYVRLDGIWDDPEEAYKLDCASTGADCNFEEAEYPISGDLAQMIVQYILQVDFNRPPADDKTEVHVNEKR